MSEVAGRGARVVLATSSREEDLERLREAIGADDSIEDAVSKGDVEHSEPSRDIFVAVLKKFDLDPDTTLVVGDTPWDAEAAGARSVSRWVCVLTGGATRTQLEEAGGMVYEDVAELLEHLDESPLGEPVTNQSGDRWDERIPRRSDMPDVDEDDDRETDGDQSAPEDHLTGEKQAAINRENDPPA